MWLNCLDELGVRMADRNSADSRNPILISITFMIKKILKMSFCNQKGFFIVMPIKSWHVVFSILPNFLIGSAIVGSWLVSAVGQSNWEASLWKDIEPFHFIISFKFKIILKINIYILNNLLSSVMLAGTFPEKRNHKASQNIRKIR